MIIADDFYFSCNWSTFVWNSILFYFWFGNSLRFSTTFKFTLGVYDAQVCGYRNVITWMTLKGHVKVIKTTMCKCAPVYSSSSPSLVSLRCSIQNWRPLVRLFCYTLYIPQTATEQSILDEQKDSCMIGWAKIVTFGMDVAPNIAKFTNTTQIFSR